MGYYEIKNLTLFRNKTVVVLHSNLTYVLNILISEAEFFNSLYGWFYLIET